MQQGRLGGKSTKFNPQVSVDYNWFGGETADKYRKLL